MSHRYDQCDATCTVDCGHCKGEGPPATTYGMCTACGSVEVALNAPHGTRDLSYMGESPRYPVGYGCEVCA